MSKVKVVCRVGVCCKMVGCMVDGVGVQEG